MLKSIIQHLVGSSPRVWAASIDILKHSISARKLNLLNYEYMVSSLGAVSKYNFKYFIITFPLDSYLIVISCFYVVFFFIPLTMWKQSDTCDVRET